MKSSAGLLSLDEHVLSIVQPHLTFVDRLRLSLSCRVLCRVCRQHVQHLLLAQQDLEQSDAFAVFPHVRHLNLHEPSIDRDLVLFLIGESAAQLQQLTTIHMTDPSFIDSSSINLLLGACPALTSFHVHGDWQCGSGFTHAQPVSRNLQCLSLQHNAHMTISGLGDLLFGLACCSRTRLVCPQGSPLPAGSHLRKLDLSGCSKLGTQVDFLQDCPGLETLLLHSCFKVSNFTFKDLPVRLAGGAADMQPGCLPLKHLDLSYTRVSDCRPHRDVLERLAAAMPHLQRLSLKGCNVGDDGLLHLLQLQQLTALHIKHCHRVTEDGIRKLSVLSGLQELSLGYTSMPKADNIAAAIAAQFKQLTGLDLLSSKLTDKGIASLGLLRNLQQLHLYQSRVSCSGLEAFAQQPGGQQLQSLVLYGFEGITTWVPWGFLVPAKLATWMCHKSDLEDVPAALQQLTAFQYLTSLVLERIDGITVRALQHVLRGCRNLSKLRVRGCDGVSQDDMEQLATSSAELCRSSASLYWAGSSSADTDDEGGGDRLLRP